MTIFFNLKSMDDTVRQDATRDKQPKLNASDNGRRPERTWVLWTKWTALQTSARPQNIQHFLHSLSYYRPRVHRWPVMMIAVDAWREVISLIWRASYGRLCFNPRIPAGRCISNTKAVTWLKLWSVSPRCHQRDFVSGEPWTVNVNIQEWIPRLFRLEM